jgi:hypothetical protein
MHRHCRAHICQLHVGEGGEDGTHELAGPEADRPVSGSGGAQQEGQQPLRQVQRRGLGGGRRLRRREGHEADDALDVWLALRHVAKCSMSCAELKLLTCSRNVTIYWEMLFNYRNPS